jgi:dynein heavy chain 1
MPSRMRQYSAFEHVQETVRGLLKINVLVGELKSDALRERHWRQLFKILRSAQGFSSLTLGQVYDLDLRRNESLIRDVLAQAAGEMALEEYLKQVRETWTSYALELVQYQTKCRLIKGWDELFARCGEHVAALAAMRLSPYYKEFEEEAAAWEAKLNRVHVLFDVWIDVQRQWVYLEGIFAGSADIKHLLPVESARFANINTEFLAVMKRVYKSPLVLDVLAIPGAQKSLERLADLLAKIQKALGEYLERERASFPRFYFVGDEDLLEIIGNSKDVVRVMKHLKKMFAGVSALVLDADGGRIDGVASGEGEEIRFGRPIVLAETPRINDWLARIESETRLTLALLLGQAVTELEGLLAAELADPIVFLAWVDRFPCQLVVLAVQCAWTKLVDGALDRGVSLEPALATVGRCLDLLADAVLEDLMPTVRRKAEHLITELVHERDVVRSLIAAGVTSRTSFEWLYHMRFDFDPTKADPLDRLRVHMADASFAYGFEYLGVPDRLVQTPLTDRCYLTLTQALSNQLGGSPFGPAGTGECSERLAFFLPLTDLPYLIPIGKTESVKALGAQLGRFVLVFCCDESFDFQAMGRIFVGLCQVGAWGCFDEFNRLEERILSAVSQQVQTIQQGLSAVVHNPEAEIELVGKQLKVNANTGSPPCPLGDCRGAEGLTVLFCCAPGLFITMNPGYAGRSNLPDNLKSASRSCVLAKRPCFSILADGPALSSQSSSEYVAP